MNDDGGFFFNVVPMVPAAADPAGTYQYTVDRCTDAGASTSIAVPDAIACRHAGMREYSLIYILYIIYYILYTIYYTILYYTILYYTILYYTILYYTILYYTILYYTIYYIVVSKNSISSGVIEPVLWYHMESCMREVLLYLRKGRQGGFHVVADAGTGAPNVVN